MTWFRRRARQASARDAAPRRLEELESELHALKTEVEDLRRALAAAKADEAAVAGLKDSIRAVEDHVHVRSSLFFRAFAVAGFSGDFVEFGVFSGHTLSHAYWAAVRHVQMYSDGAWDMASDEPGSLRKKMVDGFHAMRFFGFDSFRGMPARESPNGRDLEQRIFRPGSYAAPKTVAIETLSKAGVQLNQVHLVEGFFEQTCTPATAAQIGLTRIGVVHIDCDLYSSAITALNFCTPYLLDGAIVIFDDWFQFAGRRDMGEQRAFGEWLQRNPGWQAQELAREPLYRIAFILNRSAPGSA